LKEVKKFLKTPGGIDQYVGVDIQWVRGHNPDLVIVKPDGTQEIIDLKNYNTNQKDLHELFKKHFRRKTASDSSPVKKEDKRPKVELPPPGDKPKRKSRFPDQDSPVKRLSRKQRDILAGAGGAALNQTNLLQDYFLHLIGLFIAIGALWTKRNLFLSKFMQTGMTKDPEA